MLKLCTHMHKYTMNIIVIWTQAVVVSQAIKACELISIVRFS